MFPEEISWVPDDSACVGKATHAGALERCGEETEVVAETVS